jgi:outer membrane protein, heavy metal efflux system
MRMDIRTVEKRFIEQNLDLLIAKTNIDQSKAILLQSRLFDNPELTTDRTLYDPAAKKLMPFKFSDPSTQLNIQINQLISTAGKHFKQIQINKQGVQLTEYQYFDVLRALRYDLRDNFYDLYQQYRKMEVLQEGIRELARLIDATQVQVDKGFIARKELIRLQSLMLQYMSSQTDMLNQISTNQADLKRLLNYRGNEVIIPTVADATVLPAKIAALTFDSIQATAFANRYDMLGAKLNTSISRNSITLERMRAVPNINLGLEYDHIGTLNAGYYGILFGMPLPVFNRNQGNIKLAKATLKQSEYQEQSKELEIHNALQEKYAQLLHQRDLYQSIEKKYLQSFDDIYHNIYDSYRNRTIGIMEFLDYFDSYKDTRYNLIEVESNLRRQAEKLNLETGKDIL